VTTSALSLGALLHFFLSLGLDSDLKEVKTRKDLSSPVFRF